MRRRVLLGLLLLGAVLLPQPVSARIRRDQPLVLVRHDRVALHAAPSFRARVLARLVEQTQVRLLGKRGAWDRVLLWESIHGWIRRGDLTTRAPWPTVSTYRAPEIHTSIPQYGPAPLHVSATLVRSVDLLHVPGGTAIRTLPVGATVQIRAFRQDTSGRVWYAVENGWLTADAVRFTHSLASAGATAPVRGKGMWLTLGVIANTSPAILIRAAQRTGVTHLYLEAAISPLGFHGRSTVGPLLDAAHRAHIGVVAWVYPYLLNITGDVRLTQAVAAFRTPAGARFDGIAADLERNITTAGVRTYGQLVRAFLGSHYLLIGVTYPPQSSPEFPFGAVAASFNVIAPMDYWHQSKVGHDYGGLPYGRSYGYRYALDSIRGIRAAAGIPVSVAPIGQTFDNFGRLEMGPEAPSAGEVEGFLEGCAAGGAIGVSFFQWMTATSSEWAVIHRFRFRPS